jgi:DNA processing protein
MNQIIGFWHGAACLSGRIDFSVAIHEHGKRLSRLSPQQLTHAGISLRHQKRLLNAPSLQTIHRALRLCDSDYPESLRNLPFAPPVLFYQGNLQLMSEPCIAMVGARRCTQRGRELTHKMASELTANGLVIVSGLAYGIDSTAHRACPSRTIAVLGAGMDSAMRGHKATQIGDIVAAGGLVVSEFPPQVPASRYTFPQRNRIIAGLGIATVVIEATMRSGSRITARHAMDAGRDVMAVPGHPFDVTSSGCNALIQEGAALVQNARDVLYALGMDVNPPNRTLPDSPVAQQVIKALDMVLTFDDLLAKTELSIPQLLSTIESLELTGWVQRLPGDRLSRRNTP